MSDSRYLRVENTLPELLEEAGEVIQECSKIIQAGGKMLRWGIVSIDPHTGIEYNNARDVRAACSNLERELEDLHAAIVRFKTVYHP